LSAARSRFELALNSLRDSDWTGNPMHRERASGKQALRLQNRIEIRVERITHVLADRSTLSAPLAGLRGDKGSGNSDQRQSDHHPS
jgi:hypothetical protein